MENEEKITDAEFTENKPAEKVEGDLEKPEEEEEKAPEPLNVNVDETVQTGDHFGALPEEKLEETNLEI